MLNGENMFNEAVVLENYKNTDNLETRKSLHEKYSTNKTGYQKWMFTQYKFQPGAKILDIGSGRGEIWKYYLEDEDLLKYGMEITISDSSDGMVEYLTEIFEGKGISVKKIDINDIPYDDEYFDIVIANSMLYHVKDIDRALSEVKRVLKNDGIFYTATFGENGMIKYLYDSFSELGISYKNNMNISFTLQNGGRQLEKYFSNVTKIDYVDSLRIDNVSDYLEYVYSMSSLKGLNREYYPILLKYFENKKEDGYLCIPKEHGMFIAL